MTVKIISELGINHQGNLDICKQMMKASKDAGCDYVKFQKRTINKVFTKEQLAGPAPLGQDKWKTYGEYKYGLEFTLDQYAEIDEYSEEIGVGWFVSPWDEASVEVAVEFQNPYIKIASPCLTNQAILDASIKTKIPLIISCGMTNENTLNDVLHYIKNKGGNIAAILACVSNYPCPDEEVNLAKIDTLKNMYYWATPEFGYSSHAKSPYPAAFAVAHGATWLEQHFTLDRTMWGSDQSSSLEPRGMEKLVSLVRGYEKWVGNGKIEVIDSEVKPMSKLRTVNNFKPHN